MEITEENFEKHLCAIENNLKTCTFIAFDAEFSGLLQKELSSNSLFETVEKRYKKWQKPVEEMIILQLGLTTFHFDRDKNKYTASPYTFNLSPQHIASVNQKFTMEPQSTEFLQKNKFDLNKIIYHGLPYLSKADEDTIVQMIKDDTLWDSLLQNMDFEDRENRHDYCSQVAAWLSDDSKMEPIIIEICNHRERYILHKQLRLRFRETISSEENGKIITINKPKKGAEHTTLNDNEIDQKLLTNILGFSQIFKLLENVKKPIVGHNIFYDLLMIYKQFVGPLPSRYETFKRDFHKRFPSVFDTKQISFMLKKDSNKEFNKDGRKEILWDNSALNNLFEFFKDGSGRHLALYSPSIVIEDGFEYKPHFHQAGWDSYCTGYCFIRLCHWAACRSVGAHRAMGSLQQLAAVELYRNQVNVSRGMQPFMDLGGADPPKHRPAYLYVQTLHNNTINVTEVATELARFGALDIKRDGRNGALVAVSNNYALHAILQRSNSEKFKISVYSPLRHSCKIKMAMWSSVAISGGLLFFFINGKLNT